LEIEKIDHLHIYVKDLEKAIERFTDQLGLQFTDIMNWEKYGLRDAYAPPGLNVIQETGKSGLNISEFIKQRGEGIAGISFKVSNIEEAVAELQAKGLKLLSKVTVGDVTEALFAPPDSFGVILELCEYPGDDIHEASLKRQLPA